MSFSIDLNGQSGIYLLEIQSGGIPARITVIKR